MSPKKRYKPPLVEAEPKPEAAPMPKAEPKKKTKHKPPVVEQAVTAFLWNGTTRYRCSKCPYDAGTEVEAYNHFIRNHAPAPAPPVQHVDTGLVTSGGEKIVRVEEAQNGENTPDRS